MTDKDYTMDLGFEGKDKIHADSYMKSFELKPNDIVANPESLNRLNDFVRAWGDIQNCGECEYFSCKTQEDGTFEHEDVKCSKDQDFIIAEVDHRMEFLVFKPVNECKYMQIIRSE